MSEIDDFEPNIDDLGDLDVGDDLGDEPSDDNQDDKNVGFDLDFSFDEPVKSVDDELVRLRAENEALRAEKNQWQKSNPSEPDVPPLRAMPTEEDHDWDRAKFLADMDAWLAERDEYHRAVAEHNSKYDDIDKRYFASVDNFSKQVADYQAVESQVAVALSDEQQALLKMVVDDVAPFAYFLGKSSNTLDKLAKLEPVAFIKQVAILEQQFANRPKSSKSKPMPKEHELVGSAVGGDSQLAKLEAEALRTGDRTQVQAYKRQLKAKGRL